jgi:hypothetical protein
MVLYYLKVPVALSTSKFRNREFFVIFLMVIIAQIVDETIGSLADILKDFTVSFWGVALFIGVSIVYGFGQYFILGMVKAKNKEKEIRRTHYNILEKIVTIIQYVLTAIMVLVVLQIILYSGYSIIMLRIAVIVSSGLAIYTMSLLSYSLLSWFRVNRALVVLLYGLAAALIAINLVAVAAIFEFALQEKPALITPQSDVTFTALQSEIISNLLNTVQTVCLIISYPLIWSGTILLLHQKVYRIGKVKFWVLVSTPLIVWSIFTLSFYQLIATPAPAGVDPVMSIAVPFLYINFSGITSQILIGVIFSSVAKALSHAPIIRDYMMITAYGFILFFTAIAATIVGAGYPPFGLVNVLLVGPFSFLLLTGLYRSAICVAEDIKLRQSIKNLAKRESKLLDITASAEVQLEIQNKVMTTIKANAEQLEQESGVKPSLTHEEIKRYLEDIILETVQKGKR